MDPEQVKRCMKWVDHNADMGLFRAALLRGRNAELLERACAPLDPDDLREAVVVDLGGEG